MENPACLGELLERLVHSAAARALEPLMAEDKDTQKPSSPSEVPGLKGSEAGVVAYKSYWSKFKRPSTCSEASAPVDKTPKKEEMVVRVDSQTSLEEQLPDNQLGDSSLYPPSPVPATPMSAVAAASQTETPEPMPTIAAAVPEPTANPAHTDGAKQHGQDQGQGSTPEQKSPEGSGHHTHDGGAAGEGEKSSDLSPFGGEFSESFQKALDDMFGPTPQDKGPEQKHEELVETKPEEKPDTDRKFSPTSRDVHACLMRKTTVDLAAESMAGHTQVLMHLAGVCQPVWVPLTVDQALAAGLQLYDADKNQAATASPGQEHKPPSMSAPATTASGDQQTAGPAPSTAQPQQTAPAEPTQQTDGKTDDAAAKALKNGYMRFFRSVNSA